MTAKPDLAALAREIRETARKFDRGHTRHTLCGWAERLDAVLSEPAAEEPIDWRKAADNLLATKGELQAENESLRAQLAAVLSEPAAEAEVTNADVNAVFAGAMLDMRRKLADARAQLAAAAPLFEAAHATPHEQTRASVLAAEAYAWARSEACQRWKKEQGT